nr:hypothetical protein [Polyangiaceae bacterium]
FPKETEQVRVLETLGQTERLRCSGQVVKLTTAKLRLLASMLQRKVVRFAGSGLEDVAPPGTVDTGMKQGRPASFLTIPTAEEVEQLKRNLNRVYRPFVAQAGDRPMSEFIYCVPVLDEHPSQRLKGMVALPAPLSVTGVVLPSASTPPVPRGATLRLVGAADNWKRNYSKQHGRG